MIGGIAVAIHGYLRATRDLDLAIVTGHLREHAAALDEAGIPAHYFAPDEMDPVDGVVRIEVAGADPVEIVNFGTTHPSVRQRLGLDAVQCAKPVLEGSSLPIVGLGHLVAMKLLGGGIQDRADIVMLLRGRSVDEIADVENTCARYALTEALARVRAER